MTVTDDALYAEQVNQPGWVCTECGAVYPFDDPPLHIRCARWEWFDGCGPGTDRPGKYRGHGRRCDGVRLSREQRQAIATAYQVGGLDAEEALVASIMGPLKMEFGYVGTTLLKRMLHRDFGYTISGGLPFGSVPVDEM